MEKDKKIIKTLETVAMKTLENLCFVFPTIVLAKHQLRLDKEITVAVKFHGSYDGDLAIALYGGILSVLATNMLGEKELTEQQKKDALCEITNIICGNFLPEFFGKTMIFDIDAPRILQSDNVMISPLKIQFGLELGRVDITLNLNNKAESTKEAFE